MAESRDLFSECIGFDWDNANIDKNWDRHQVTQEEAEDVFFLRQTVSGRRLFVSFTIRRKLILVISVRDMNHKEQNIYDQYEEANS